MMLFTVLVMLFIVSCTNTSAVRCCSVDVWLLFIISENFLFTCQFH